MSIRRGNSVIASSGANGLQMFDFKWSDHTIDDLNWISSHSNSYHSGNTYKKMYNHLVEDYHNGVDETEVIGSYTISYKLAPDGHKIVDAVSSGVVDNIYVATGIAWYYVLDTTNNQFKLPRTKFGFVGLRDNVGNYVPESLPNIKGEANQDGINDSTSNGFVGWGTPQAPFYRGGTNPTVATYTASGTKATARLGFDASLSSSAYQNNAPVQERATQMLLYFYTDQFESTGLPNTSAKNVVDDTLNSIRTNCITEIPQDIKLELNNGTLTLKAGSKIYVPNGFEEDGTTPKFDVITLTQDIVEQSVGWSDATGMLFFKNNDLTFTSLSQLYSGASGVLSNGNIWYDTTTNFIKRCNNGSTWTSGYSLPISIVTSNGQSQSTTPLSSIDQVFNGLGYIGSTVFALPGIKGLIPNGRNADGTLKNIEFTTTDVKTITFNNNFNGGYVLLNTDGLIGGNKLFYYNKAKEDLIVQEATYIEEENRLYRYGVLADALYEPLAILVATISSGTNGVITSFTPKTTFHTLDCNDKSMISGWCMPSDRYIDLTLGSSGSTYTAPANGYFYLDKDGGVDGSQVLMMGPNISTEHCIQYSSNTAHIYLPAKKGDIVKISYSITGTTNVFRFVYAEGEI